MAIIANRHWLLLALLTAAIVSYGVGFTFGLALFVAAGGCIELVFWVALINRRRRR